MQVLLVDDSPVMRRYVSRVLRMTGLDMTIHEAEDGRDAMLQAAAIRPDLIITDLNMPQMSGEELVARVESDLKGTPVLVLSADRSPSRLDELKQAGAAAYLTKPVTPESLRKELIAIMEAR